MSNGLTVESLPIAADVPINDVTVHVDVSKLIVYVGAIVHINVASARVNPASTAPTMIVRTSAMPVPVAVQP
jgi:hypothetical protein